MSDDFPSDEEMPEGMKWLFSYYEECIAYAKEHTEKNNRNVWAADENHSDSPNRTEAVYLSKDKFYGITNGRIMG